MNYLQYIIALCWIVFLIYWAWGARNLKKTKETAWEDKPFRWVILGFIILIVLVGRLGLLDFVGLPTCTLEWSGCHIGFLNGTVLTSITIQIISVVLAVLGLFVAIIARKELADNWSGRIDLKENHKLVTSGIYNYIRHPIYTGVLTMFFGTALFYESLVIWFLFVVFTVFFGYKLKAEERFMSKHFPKEYPEYKKHTKYLIPFVF